MRSVRAAQRVARSSTGRCPSAVAPEKCACFVQSSRIHPSLAGCGSEIIEMHVAVRLRPQADAARDRRRQGVLEIELAVEITFHIIVGNADLKVVPLLARCGRVPDPLHLGATPFLDLPEHQIVFQAIRPNRQVIAIRLEIEQNASALVDAARQAFEADAALQRRRGVGRLYCSARERGAVDEVWRTRSAAIGARLSGPHPIEKGLRLG